MRRTVPNGAATDNEVVTPIQNNGAMGSASTPHPTHHHILPSKKRSHVAPKPKKRGLFYGILLTASVVWIFKEDIFPSMGASTTPSSTSSHRTADGTFNQYPIYLEQNKPLRSAVHCVGETHDKNSAWMHRSCEFTNLCLDTASREFYVVAPQEDQKTSLFRQHPGAYVSTDLQDSNNNNITLALGGINPRWAGTGSDRGIEKVQWFPKRLAEAPASYYTLDPDVVMPPFHSFAAHNVGHLVWDDFLPIYTLLKMFGFIDDGPSSESAPNPWLLLRVDTLPPLFGTCDMTRNKKNPNPRKLLKCAANFEKFLPLLGVRPPTFSTLKTLQFEPYANNNPTTTWVCAKHAVAGLGMLTDHGLQDHGWNMPQEHAVHNTAKGAMLYQFRNFVLQNLNLPSSNKKEEAPTTTTQRRMVLSAHSSGYKTRDVDFKEQERILSQAFPSWQIQIAALAQLGVQEQIELASTTQIFVSVCGGGAMTATFLPRGATLILYYDETGGYDFATHAQLGSPAFLDWDLLNNMAYLRVHWLPLGGMHTPEGLRALQSLIQHEVDALDLIDGVHA